jgi:hypothetical protein
MSLVTIEIKYCNSKTGKLISPASELFDILRVLEKSSDVEKFSTYTTSAVGPEYFGFGKAWSKWFWVNSQDEIIETVYILLVSKNVIPPESLVKQPWKLNGDDYVLVSTKKNDLNEQIQKLNLSPDKYQLKNFKHFKTKV